MVKKTGPPDVLELVSDWPVPSLRDGEVTLPIILDSSVFSTDAVFINQGSSGWEL